MQILVPKKTGECEEYFEKNFFEKAQKNVILQAFQIGKKFVANPVIFSKKEKLIFF